MIIEKVYDPSPGFEPVESPAQVASKVIPSHIGENGLVGNWLFYTGAGDLLHDFSPEENDGSISGAEWEQGRWGWSLYFPGTDEYVDCGTSASLNISGDLTVVAWVRADSLPFSDFVGILGKLNGTAGYSLAGDDGTSDVMIMIRSGGAGANVTGTVTEGEWHHLAGRFRDSDNVMELFINATSQGTATHELDTSTATFAIGRNDWWKNYFNGGVKLARVYDRRLTAEEITRSFERERGIFGV